MSKSETNANYYAKNREKILAHAKEYYAEHKDKVLTYKKQFYKKRTNKYNITKFLQLKGLNKKQSKAVLKSRIDDNCLRVSIVKDNEDTEELDYSNFIISYELKDTPIIIDYQYNSTCDCDNIYDPGDIMTIFIPKFYVKNIVFSEN